MGYPRLALTDTDNLYGLWPFLAACRREGLTPIVGAEITEPAGDRRAICLVRNTAGYANLCRLISRRHMADDFDLTSAIPVYGAGLIVLTQNADQLANWHESGVCVAAAMPRRPLPAGHPLCRKAGDLGVPAVATPGTFFLEPQGFKIHRFLRAIEQNTAVSRLGRSQIAPADAWLRTPDEYARRFDIRPDAIRATYRLAERITFKGPDFGLVLPPWADRSGRSAEKCLWDAAYEGARRRYGDELPESVVERLEHEIKIIRRMGFSSYFLVVRDIVTLSPRTCGRGSGAASLVAYCLGITNVCPIKHNLYFERFLNPGRSDAPDIDVDFAWDERDDVQQAVLDRYRGYAAMVSNHVCFKGRMAVREISKVYGLSDGEISRMTRRLPRFWRAADRGDGMDTRLPERTSIDQMDLKGPWPEILRTARKIVGHPRYLSVHSGGVVITPGPIEAYVPIERAPKGVPIIQWEKDGAETAGLVKIDLLGNRSLGVIRDAVADIRTKGIAFDESRWEPEDDFSTQEAVAQGLTMGCFYIESPAMRLLQQKSGVGDFEHLVIHSSIIRPAANEFIREYIRRLHGGLWDPIHPLLNDVLEETFGIMVYQEDVSRAAVALAGFSSVEADGLRKIMSKKDRDRRIGDYYRRFRKGAESRGVTGEQIDMVWAMIMSFSGYSFCKPHSASYARVSFQAAYLKVHYPAEFMAAVISNRGGFYSTFAYVSEARRMGLAILPPDVQNSGIRWTGRGRRIRVGLLSIKGLSGKTRKRIVSQRLKRPFKNMPDFLIRVQPDDPEARALIDCGALDGFSPTGNRVEMMWEYTRWQKKSAGNGKTGDLFESLPDRLSMPPLPPQSERRRLRREFGILGFLCDRHPIVLYADVVDRLRAVKAINLSRYIGRHVRIVGWLITAKTVNTKHGDPMEFLTFEDETGIFETTFFPETYRRFHPFVDQHRPYLLSGRVEQDWGAITVTVDRVKVVRRLTDKDESGNSRPAI
jgi:DNA polymerase-3 subunit alpha/error-prone DNA polymerase